MYLDNYNQIVKKLDTIIEEIKNHIKPVENDDSIDIYEREFYPLSNFSAFRLDWKGVIFDTSEAAYQSEKFHSTNSAVYNMIINAPSAHEAFKIAQEHKSLRRPDWDDIKFSVMKDILREKCKQHEYVRRKLLETGHREIIEKSWRDDVYGWGPNKNGQNMLGKLWMEVRGELNE